MSDGPFFTLYDEYQSQIWAFIANRIGRDDADDAAQEIWMRVHKNLATFDGKHFRGWLFQIARNYLIDRQRRKKDSISLGDIDPFSEPEFEVDEERILALKSCLEELKSAKPREAEIVSGKWQGLKYEVIARRLDITHQRASELFYSAKTALRSCIEGKLA